MSKLYFEALGIDLEDKSEENRCRLREAYDKAHEIRQFEIELYWRRSTYFWTMQAAVLAGIALVYLPLGGSIVSSVWKKFSNLLDH